MHKGSVEACFCANLNSVIDLLKIKNVLSVYCLLQVIYYPSFVEAALNETLREEVNRLKIETGQVPPLNGNSYNQALPPQFSSHPQMYNNFINHQGYQAQQQQPTRIPPSAINYDEARHGQPQASFPNYNQRV